MSDGEVTSGVDSSIRLLYVGPDADGTVRDRLADGTTFEVEAVETADEAGDRVETGGVDCVLADHDPPATDAVGVVETVDERRPDLPSFVLAADPEVAAAAVTAGATDHVSDQTLRERPEVAATRVENAVKRRRTERSERRLREVLEQTTDVHWTFDADWEELLYVNDAYETVYGGSIADLRADPERFLDAIHPEDREAVRAAMERLADGEPTDVEYRVDPDADYGRWVHVRGHPVYEDGEVVRLVGHSRDVTERREREQELRETRRLFAESLDALDDIYYVLDPEGRVREWNETLTTVTGYDDGRIEGADALDLFHQSDRDRVQAALEAAVETGIARVEARVLTADGDTERYEFTGSRLDDEDGDLRGVIGVGRDVSERREYERTLETKNRRLEEFTGLVSHDLRNPLTAIESELELYRATGDDAHLEAIDGTIDRMERLLEELLQVARYGEAVEDPTPTDLERVVRSARTGTLSETATLEYEPVPRLLADGDRLHRLFENLFRNATEHVGADVAVWVGPIEDDTGAPTGFYVADDGPGIPPERHDKVLESGYTTAEDGTGYGLAVVRSVVEAHGWRLSIAESEDGGARFEVRGVEFLDLDDRYRSSEDAEELADADAN